LKGSLISARHNDVDQVKVSPLGALHPAGPERVRRLLVLGPESATVQVDGTDVTGRGMQPISPMRRSASSEASISCRRPDVAIPCGTPASRP